jgi:hypothetical protein
MVDHPHNEADRYSDEEIRRRMEHGLRRALSTPPQPHGKNPRSPPPQKHRKAKTTTQLRECEVCFDAIALAEELKRLSPEALESFRNHLLGDLSRLPFDIFISKLVPAVSAGSSDQIIIGFRLISARNDVSRVTA